MLIEFHLSHACEGGAQILKEQVVGGVSIDHGAGVKGPLDHLNGQQNLVRILTIVLR